jgi:hypothetical protein
MNPYEVSHTMPDEAIIGNRPDTGELKHATRKSKRWKISILGTLVFIVGMSVGYLVSLGSSFKKSAELVAAYPAAAAAMDGFSDHDMAFILRLVRGGIAGKATYKDPVVLKHIAKYYNHRTTLPAAQQKALGCCGLLKTIKTMKESNPALQRFVEAEPLR